MGTTGRGILRAMTLGECFSIIALPPTRQHTAAAHRAAVTALWLQTPALPERGS